MFLRPALDDGEFAPSSAQVMHFWLTGEELEYLCAKLNRILEKKSVCGVRIDRNLRVRDQAAHQVGQLGGDHQVTVAVCY
jgi:hypothetical protein